MMKTLELTVRVAAFAPLAGLLYAADPILATPGTATWATEATTTGSRTVFTMTNNTVLNWNQLNLARGSEMVFNFEGGQRVVNFLGGTGIHVIDGMVTSNGVVAFFSPGADLEVNGSIIARGVTLATLDTSATEFSAGGGYQMSGLEGFNFLVVDGRVEATAGDVVLGGERVIIGDQARIQASQDVLVGGGRDLTVTSSGNHKIRENSGLGYVLHLGETKAARIEITAGSEINNQGRVDAGNGRVFMQVGGEGLITNESTGVIVGNAVFTGAYDAQGSVLFPDEGDAVPLVSEGTLTLPRLTRPDSSRMTRESQTVSYSSPMSASGDAGRDSAQSGKAKKTLVHRGETKSLLQRSSFFGMRGGNSAPTKR